MRARNASASVATCLLARSRATVVSASCSVTARRARRRDVDARRVGRRERGGSVMMRNYDGDSDGKCGGVRHTAQASTTIASSSSTFGMESGT